MLQALLPRCGGVFDGKVYPCCSTFNRASPGLAIGNAFFDGFAEIRLRVLGSTMLRTIKRGNFENFLTRIEEYDPELTSIIRQLPITGGTCSFCSNIFRKPEIYSRVYSAFQAFESELISSLEQELGSALQQGGTMEK
jgi:hypothetical protein